MSDFRSISEVLNEMDRWDGKIPEPCYGPDGTELFSSKLRRAAHAYRLTEAQGSAEERRKRIAAAEAEDIRKGNEKAEQEFWDGMPNALRAMGLAEAEIRAMAGMDLEWPAVRAVKAWMGSPKLFLTMGGPVGGGKTLAAASCLLDANEVVECRSYRGKQWRPRWARFVKANEISRLSYFDKTDKVYLDRLKAVRWLVIDDLGTEAAFDTWKATFTDLVDERARNERRTIITTNLTSKALQEAYDARVWRRLQDFGEFIAAKRPETSQ